MKVKALLKLISQWIGTEWMLLKKSGTEIRRHHVVASGYSRLRLVIKFTSLDTRRRFGELAQPSVHRLVYLSLSTSPL